MSAKHTPGPWVAVERDEIAARIIAERSEV